MKVIAVHEIRTRDKANKRVVIAPGSACELPDDEAKALLAEGAVALPKDKAKAVKTEPSEGDVLAEVDTKNKAGKVKGKKDEEDLV